MINQQNVVDALIAAGWTAPAGGLTKGGVTVNFEPLRLTISRHLSHPDFQPDEDMANLSRFLGSGQAIAIRFDIQAEFDESKALMYFADADDDKDEDVISDIILIEHLANAVNR